MAGDYRQGRHGYLILVQCFFACGGQGLLLRILCHALILLLLLRSALKSGLWR